MFVIHAETVVQLDADTYAVVDALVVTAVHVLNAVAHEVRLNGFHRILTDREFVSCEVFNTPCITGEVVVNGHFFGGHEVLIPAAACGEGPVIRRPAQCGAENVLVVGFAVAVVRITHVRAGVVPRCAPGQIGGQVVIDTQ